MTASAERPRVTAAASSGRFTPLAQALHWLTALMMIVIVVIAWHMKMLQRTDEMREVWYSTHEALGITILLLTVFRLAWRHRNPPPPLPGKLNLVEQGMAKASHWALYVVLITMPVSGYTLASAAGHPLRFGLFTVPPILPLSPELANFGRTVHGLGQWALYALFVLHIAATVWHIVVRRDSILDRMLPPQTGSANQG